tara:strand:- start:2424 stop:3434 length:1011 start_codon:yes stop_codon:yes gene_type:complete
MILVTGGCGYIGSHFLLRLLLKERDVLCLDNLSNSSESNLVNIRELSSKTFTFIKGNVGEEPLLLDIFKSYKISSVVHFAGFKSVSESVHNPLKYFQNNVIETISLLKAMKAADVKKIIFSSSATVYGENHPLPWHEELKLEYPLNPYAQSKFFIELILKTLSSKKNNSWSIGILRYFNPIGYHPSGKIAEDINNNNTNLIPAIVDVILNKKKKLNIYGGDYNTPDGTGIRDYIHVEDLISGHEKALEYILNTNGYNIWNLGSGHGFSVLEIVRELERAFKKKIPYKIVNRREGDLGSYWADISKAKTELGWNTKFKLIDMAKDIANQVKYKNNGK